MHCITKLSRRLVQFQYSSFAKFTSTMTQPGTIDFEEICAGLESKSLTYMDVRNQSELQSEGKIVGSVNLPLPEIIEAFASTDDDFKNKYGFEKPSKSAALVVGCLAGKRAAAAGEQLEKLGFNNFRVYPGSFSDWKAKGGAISKHMALWNWIRAVIGSRDMHYLIGYLLRALIATDSPVELHFDEIQDRLNDRSLIYLDVRNRIELLVDGKIAGSFNIPESELEDAFDKNDREFFTQYGFCKPSKGAENIVVACHSGRRAITALDKLQRLGYGSIKIYKGSFLDWKARGGSIVKQY